MASLGEIIESLSKLRDILEAKMNKEARQTCAKTPSHEG